MSHLPTCPLFRCRDCGAVYKRRPTACARCAGRRDAAARAANATSGAARRRLSPLEMTMIFMLERGERSNRVETISDDDVRRLARRGLVDADGRPTAAAHEAMRRMLGDGWRDAFAGFGPRTGP